MPGQESPVLHTLRRLLLAILAIAMAGMAVDLMLLDHHEDLWQTAPLVLLGLGLVNAAACGPGTSRRPVVLLRTLMTMFIVAGLLGVALHYNGNLEFQKEIDPSQTGWALFVKVVTAKAPPALAPAAMAQIGLLGLLYTYQHPALRWRRSDQQTSSGEST